MKTVNYFGEIATVLEENKTHYLLLFSSGTKLCVGKGFKIDSK